MTTPLTTWARLRVHGGAGTTHVHLDALGYVSTGFVVTVALSMLLVVAAANVLIVHHAEGVLHNAAEEGVRQGLAMGSAEACVVRAREVVTAGLGILAHEVGTPVCEVTAEGARATVHATFAGWVPMVAEREMSVTATGTATLEAPE